MNNQPIQYELVKIRFPDKSYAIIEQIKREKKSESLIEFIKLPEHYKFTTNNPRLTFSEKILHNQMNNPTQFRFEELIDYKIYCILTLVCFLLCVYIIFIIDGAHNQNKRLKRDIETNKNFESKKFVEDYVLYMQEIIIGSIKPKTTLKQHVEEILPERRIRIAEGIKRLHPEIKQFYQELSIQEKEKWKKHHEKEASKPWYWW